MAVGDHSPDTDKIGVVEGFGVAAALDSQLFEQFNVGHRGRIIFATERTKAVRTLACLDSIGQGLGAAS